MILGIGTDIIEIERIKQAILEREDKFLERVFTNREKSYCAAKKNPYPSYAARFAAKEAVLKAFGAVNSSIGWQDIEVVRDEGPPQIVLHGKAVEQALKGGINRVLLSLSHSDSHAVAYAVATR